MNVPKIKKYGSTQFYLLALFQIKNKFQKNIRGRYQKDRGDLKCHLRRKYTTKIVNRGFVDTENYKKVKKG